MKTLILAEKQDQASRLAEILSNNTHKECVMNNVKYYTYDDTVVFPAKGHLLRPSIKGLRTVKSISKLPKSEIMWRTPKNDIDRLNTIGTMIKESNDVIIATDFDREGEVIGYNIIQKFLNLEPYQIKRAYFSSLGVDEIKNTFSGVDIIDESLLAQGLARNYADAIIGLNLTKALTLIFKSKYSLSQAISCGRVQSPLLTKIEDFSRVSYNKKAKISKTDEKLVRHFIKVGELYYSINLPDNTSDSEIEVTRVIEEEEEIQQAETLWDTNELISKFSNIDPNYLINVLVEGMYLRGLTSYPRTKSKWLSAESAKKLLAIIKENIDVPDTFSEENMVDVERGKKTAIVPTIEGLKAYFDGGLSFQERLIMKALIVSILRAVACPLLKSKVYLEVDTQDDTIYDVDWSEYIKNLEDAIQYETTETRPEIEEGVYEMITIPQKVHEESSLYALYAYEIKTPTNTDLVKWMEENEIGTEATRPSFPIVLQNRGYTDGSNIISILGKEVSGIIEKSGLTTKLTAKMEGMIDQLKTLDDLQPFIDEIVGETKGFLSEFKDVSVNLKCPEGHENIDLINSLKGLFLRCEDCNKFYPIKLS